MVALPARTVMHGNPPVSTHRPDPDEMRSWMEAQESIAAGGGLSYIDDSLTDLQARVGTTDGQFGLVLNDQAEAGVYERVASVWTKVADVPVLFGESIDADRAEAAAAAAEAAAAQLSGVVASVADYGDGSFTQANVDAMIADVGFVNVSGANTIAENVVVDCQLTTFARGAYVSVNSGFELQILGKVESPRQHIFRGDGTLTLGDGNTSNNGDNARQVHVSWFGAFPNTNPLYNGDQAPYIQKAFDAMGTGREGVVDFDAAPYFVGTAMTVPRGTWVRGAGTRRTLFVPLDAVDDVDDSWVLFTTTGDAVHFTDIQFEHPNQLTTERSGAYIQVNNASCELRRIVAGRAFQSIRVDASGVLLEDIWGFYNVTGSTGSSLIAIKGSKNVVRGVRNVNSAAFGPDYLIHAGADTGSLTTATTDMLISGLMSGSPNGMVLIDGAHGIVQRVLISDILGTLATAGPFTAVQINNPEANSITEVAVVGGMFRSGYNPILGISQTGAGTVRDILIDNCMAEGTTGNVVAATRTDGDCREITIGPGNHFRDKTDPISITGTVTQVFHHSMGLKDGAVVQAYGNVVISDDGVFIIDMHQAKFAGTLQVVTNNGDFGTWRARAASGPALTAMGTVSGITTTTGALTGTTGTDGNITVSVGTDGKFYVENRSGGSLTCFIEAKA